MSAEFKLLF